MLCRHGDNDSLKFTPMRFVNGELGDSPFGEVRLGGEMFNDLGLGFGLGHQVSPCHRRSAVQFTWHALPFALDKILNSL